MLTQKFKRAELRTIEDLTKDIISSGILPVPEVEVLDYIWDWKMFALDNLSKEELRNHSNYHAFNIKKEKGQARLRGKRYSFEKEWIPSAGIRLLSEDTTLLPIGPAQFRIESLNLPKVFQDLQRYFVTLPLEDRMIVQSSWENLRKKIEDLPLQLKTLTKMDLRTLPVQCADNQVVIPDHLAHLNKEDNIKDL